MDEKIPPGYGPDDEVDYEGPDPLWLQVAAILRARIERGDYAVRRPIPSESQIMGEFGIARGTARKVVGLLAQLGYVRTVPGRGSFVLDRSEATPAPKDSPEPPGPTR